MKESDDYKKVLADIAKEMYEDGLKEPVKETGKVLGLIPRAIHAFIVPFEKWILNRECTLKITEKLLSYKLENFDPSMLEAPDNYVAVPAINALSYSCGSESLLDMYANLLATSMIKDRKWEVHPAFVEIIKQLSPDEAKLLKKIADNIGENEFPLINLIMKKGDEVNLSLTKFYYLKNFSDIGDDICDFPEKISTYIENLIRFNIIEVCGDLVLTNGDYSNLENHNIILKTKNDISLRDGFEWDLEKSIFMVTNFGKTFISVCVNSPNQMK